MGFRVYFFVACQQSLLGFLVSHSHYRELQTSRVLSNPDLQIDHSSGLWHTCSTFLSLNWVKQNICVQRANEGRRVKQFSIDSAPIGEKLRCVWYKKDFCKKGLATVITDIPLSLLTTGLLCDLAYIRVRYCTYKTKPCTRFPAGEEFVFDDNSHVSPRVNQYSVRLNASPRPRNSLEVRALLRRRSASHIWRAKEISKCHKQYEKGAICFVYHGLFSTFFSFKGTKSTIICQFWVM